MSPVLDAAERRAYERMASDLTRIFGDRFVSLVASPAGAVAAFATTIGADDLDAIGSLASAWRHDGGALPLIVTVDEFTRSLDTFPIEFQTLLDNHVVIAGRPPFDGAA